MGRQAETTAMPSSTRVQVSVGALVPGGGRCQPAFSAWLGGREKM